MSILSKIRYYKSSDNVKDYIKIFLSKKSAINFFLFKKGKSDVKKIY